MAMTTRIETEWPSDANGWFNLLSDKRRAKVQEAVAAAKRDDNFVSEIVLTQFSDKADIVRKQHLASGSKSDLKKAFRSILKLRDNIAHSNYYAETPEAARAVSLIVRKILRIKDHLLQSS